MDFEISKKEFSIIIVLVIILIGIDVLIYLFANKENLLNGIDKNNNNVYNSSYITADKQASIYLSNYYNLIKIDSKSAFAKFERNSLKHLYTQDQFDAYVSRMNLSSTKISKLNYYKKGKYIYYAVIDGNGNHITFKTEGVMNYTVNFK